MGRWEGAKVIALDTLATVVIGFFVTSYWRGTWTLFDIWLCDQPPESSLLDGTTFCFAGVPDEAALHLDSGWKSVGIGWGLTITGVALMWSGLWRPAVVDVEKVHITPIKAAARFLIVYILGMGAVNVWRGVWYVTDYYLLPTKLTANEWLELPLTSYWVSSVVGSTACFVMHAGASLLAPPAIFLIDGPGVNPPPMAVTLVSSYFSLKLPAKAQPPELPFYVVALDLLFSFTAVPIMVVWFWRGSWLLMDFYLWGFSPEPQDLNNSIAWSFIIAVGLLVPTSETVFAFITIENPTVLGLLGRLRTYLMGWGIVNFWRVVWYIWDVFLGSTTLWSAWISHAIPIVCLTAMGCMSCIVAPASTMGVDVVPHPECAEDPLFHNLPVPYDDLYLLGIGRQPPTLDEATLPEDSVKSQELHIRMSILHSKTITEGQEYTEDDEDHVFTEDHAEPRPPIQKKAEADEEEIITEEDAVPRARQHKITGAEEEQIAALAASLAWSSGGTGRRGSYSSVRASGEQRRSSYFELQRPDLDRRVDHRTSIASLRSSGASVRRSSNLSRNR